MVLDALTRAGTQKLAVEGLYRVCWFSINNDNEGGTAEQSSARLDSVNIGQAAPDELHTELLCVMQNTTHGVKVHQAPGRFSLTGRRGKTNTPADNKATSEAEFTGRNQSDHERLGRPSHNKDKRRSISRSRGDGHECAESRGGGNQRR